MKVNKTLFIVFVSLTLIAFISLCQKKNQEHFSSNNLTRNKNKNDILEVPDVKRPFVNLPRDWTILSNENENNK